MSRFREAYAQKGVFLTDGVNSKHASKPRYPRSKLVPQDFFFFLKSESLR